MKKIDFNYDEVVYEEKLDNGLRVFMYPTNKTKNYYVTVSTRFGAEVSKYKKNNKVYDVKLGSAHFLEHRVMDFTKNKKAMEKINEYGSLVNAYTTYNGTNYNIFGNEKIIENIELLFDAVFKAKIKKEDVENERGIILEEYYMYNDDPYYLLHTKVNDNLFKNSFIKYPVLGTVEGIETVTDTELTRTYNDFYTLDNMFIVVVGNFDKDVILDYIKTYTNELKKTKLESKVIKEKEVDNVVTNYEEVILDLNESKINIAYKFKRLKSIELTKYKLILNMILANNFSSSSECFNVLNKEGILRYNYEVEVVDDYSIIYFKSSTNKTKEYMDIIDSYMNKLFMDKESLDRKVKRYISSLILSFEDILLVEDMITTDIFNYNKLINNRKSIVESININEVNEVINSINLQNKSIFMIK